MTLRSFFLCELDGDLLLLSLAQNRERHVRAVRECLQEFPQLARFDQNLLVEHFENIVLLNARRRCGTVRAQRTRRLIPALWTGRVVR